MSVFLKLWDTPDPDASLRNICRGSWTVDTYKVDPHRFRLVPGSPFAYWATDELLTIFSYPALESSGSPYISRIGLTTHDDFRWLRLSWECIDERFIPYAKGGSFSKWYCDLPLSVNWRPGGVLLKTSKRERWRLGELTENNSRCWNEEHYGRPGLTWPRRTAGFSVRTLVRNSVFGDKGPGIFVTGDAIADLMPLLAIVNSSPFQLALRLMIARNELAQSFEVGVVRSSPIPPLTPASSEVLTSLGGRGWSLRRWLDTVLEVSHAFVLPAVLQVNGSSFGDRVGAWSARVAGVDAELARVQAEIDELCFELYGISEEDQQTIGEGFGVSEGDDLSDASDDEEDDGAGDEEASVDPQRLAAELVSWAVGVGVGRFDVRLATGDRSWPDEPHPFDPLPVCSPGMLTGDDGLPLRAPPPGYPVGTSAVLVTDPGHPVDITSRVRSVFDAVFGNDADAWWAEVGAILGGPGGEVGTWLTKGLFDHHLKMYSKSRRKAPILWPIGTASGSYLIWLYAHRVTSDSLFQVFHDLVVPKIALEDQRLIQLRQAAGPTPTSSQRREVDKQVGFVDELRELAQRIEAVAPLWAPDLNDGIVVVLAPLWKLFAHHRVWSRELKNHWAKFAAGHYDWAQMAMHIWPERVIPKCATDRSLAIAHNVEDVFWAQDRDSPDKWHPRDTPNTPVDELITRHHNPAMAAALEKVK